MAEPSVKEHITKLIDLQVIDEVVFRFKRVLREKPQEIDALRLVFESKKAKLQTLEAQLKVIQVAQKERELDLKAKEEGIAKAESSVMALKTNKEYQARLLEIENLKADRSVVEEKILLGFDALDSARALLEAEKKIVAEHEKEYTTQKKQTDDEIMRIQEQLAVYETKRLQVTPEIRPEYLSRYERIVTNKDGLGIVKVEDHTCSGCHMHLTEQVLNELKKCTQMIACDMCARILYLEDALTP